MNLLSIFRKPSVQANYEKAWNDLEAALKRDACVEELQKLAAAYNEANLARRKAS